MGDFRQNESLVCNLAEENNVEKIYEFEDSQNAGKKYNFSMLILTEGVTKKVYYYFFN